MRLHGARLREVTWQHVVKGGNIGAALDAAMTAQRENTAAGAANIAEKALNDCRGTDHLYSGGVMGPADGITPGAGTLTTGVVQQSFSHLEKCFFRAATDPLDHLRRIGGVVSLDNLINALRVLQR